MMIDFRRNTPPSTYLGRKVEGGGKPQVPGSHTVKPADVDRQHLTATFRAKLTKGKCCTIESIRTNSATVWYGTLRGRHRVVRAAQVIVGLDHPGQGTVNHDRLTKKAHNTYTDMTHPGHSLFETLPSGRRFGTIEAKTSEQSSPRLSFENIQRFFDIFQYGFCRNARHFPPFSSFEGVLQLVECEGKKN